MTVYFRYHIFLKGTWCLKRFSLDLFKNHIPEAEFLKLNRGFAISLYVFVVPNSPGVETSNFEVWWLWFPSIRLSLLSVFLGDICWVVWGPVVWDSNRRTPKKHFRLQCFTWVESTSDFEVSHRIHVWYMRVDLVEIWLNLWVITCQIPLIENNVCVCISISKSIYIYRSLYVYFINIYL